jgi:predicted DNA-binding transcriptional regulator AlpA
MQMPVPDHSRRPENYPVDELLTLEEVAAMLKLPPATLRKWRTENQPPQAFRIGRWLRYRRSAVEAFLAQQEAKEHD